jgi:hypothetical protein
MLWKHKNDLKIRTKTRSNTKRPKTVENENDKKEQRA